MKKFQKTVTVYELGEGFFAEVSKQNEFTEFYLFHEDYSTKDLMFGIANLGEAEEEEYLCNNADTYIEFYKSQYMED